MTGAETNTDWQRGIAERFAIQPTVDAMQRHLLFTLRSASVRSGEVGPGEFQTHVELGDCSWIGSGASAVEAMGQVLLNMTNADGSVNIDRLNGAV